MLVDFGVTALVVTHDRWFLDRVATSVLAFEEGGRAIKYPGNYQTYRSLRAQQQAERPSVPAPGPASAPAPRADRSAKKKGLSNVEQRELGGLPDAIEKAERRVAELGAKLADPATYASGGKEVAQLNAEVADAKAQVDKLTLRWEELELKRGE
jgi:ATP-binding cassette subfamily F protein uup